MFDQLEKPFREPDPFAFGSDFGAGRRSSAPAAIPISLGASSVFMRNSLYCFSDDAGTTPCTNSDTLRTWQDAVSGTKYTWTGGGMAGPPVRPVYRTAGIDFSAASAMFDAIGNIWPTGALSLVARFTTSTGSGNWLASADASGVHPFHFYRNGSGGVARRWSDGPQQTVSNSTAVTLSYQGNDATLVGSVEKMRLNGGAWNTVNDARPSRGGLNRNLFFGVGDAGIYFAMTNFLAVAIFPTVLPDADFASVESWIGAL